MLLLTGSNGFIGNNLKLWLDTQYDIVTPTRSELELTNSQSVKTFFKENKINQIVHFAADPTTKLNNEEPFKIIENNLKITQNLLHYCDDNTRFIFASSVLVYGEEGKIEADLPTPTSVYGSTKSACETLIHAYSHLKGINFINLRLCATVGSGMTHGALKDIIRKVLSTDKELELFGNEPGSIKPFLHVIDVCRAVTYFLNNKVCYNDNYNICPNDNISILEIAQNVMNITNFQKPIKWLGKDSLWKGDNNYLKFSNQKMIDDGSELLFNTSQKAITEAIHENLLS